MVKKRNQPPRLFLPSLFIFVAFLFWQITGSTGQAENRLQTQQNLSFAEEQSHFLDSSMVVIDGRALFRLVGIQSYPAKKRAAKTVERIKQLAEDPSFDPGTLHVGEKDGVYTIFGNDLAIVRITSADVLLEGDFSLEAFADKVVKKQIARAIENYRYE